MSDGDAGAGLKFGGSSDGGPVADGDDVLARFGGWFWLLLLPERFAAPKARLRRVWSATIPDAFKSSAISMYLRHVLAGQWSMVGGKWGLCQWVEDGAVCAVNRKGSVEKRRAARLKGAGSGVTRQDGR